MNYKVRMYNDKGGVIISPMDSTSDAYAIERFKEWCDNQVLVPLNSVYRMSLWRGSIQLTSKNIK